MKVDVIIPAHNPGVYLRDALNSCMAQTYQNFHIYVIDDASTEDIKSLVEKYKNTTYTRLDNNIGPSATRNRGIKDGNGELISFLDADDIWEPTKLELSIKAFNEDPSVGMTCGNYRRLVNRVNLCHPFYRNPPLINWESLMRINYVASGSVTIRRDIFEELGGFDEKLWIGEDYKLWLMCSEKYKIRYIDRVLYRYSVIKSGNSLTNRDDLQDSHRGTLDLVRQESLERMNAFRRKTESGNFDKDISS